MTFTAISSAELVWMRRDEDASLVDTCDIQRMSNAIGPSGAPSKAGATYATVHAAQPCRVTFKRAYLEADITLLALQRENIATFFFVLTWNADCRANDQLIGSDGKQYLVLGTSAITSYSTKLIVLVREVGA